MVSSDKIRNLAIIAHIDHGKTTLIDSIFRATSTFRANARVEERVMDNNELERERGITIRAKHCTVQWHKYMINIIDTPGHADFSGEVERGAFDGGFGAAAGGRERGSHAADAVRADARPSPRPSAYRDR